MTNPPITDEYEHRRLAVEGKCPDCASPDEMRAELAKPYLYEPDDGLVHLLTPEGELAGDVSARYRVDDLAATAQALHGLWPADGPDHVDVLDTSDGPWVRGCVWICADGELHLSATSYTSYQRMNYELEMLWPPVWGGMSASDFPKWATLGRSVLCERPADWPVNPAHRALRELIAATEQRWLVTPTPLFDGRAPCEVARSPGGLDRVLDLMQGSDIPAEVGALAAFDFERLERALRA